MQALRAAALVGAEVDEPPYWLATEYIPGPTLAQAVAAHGAFSPRAGLRLLATLAEAVADVHAVNGKRAANAGTRTGPSLRIGPA
ncbi:hypothetical protein [Actinomadura chokoriensis]|uniref:Protein kinase domain-containing protein n=1 Tax=Actinomadura chokoriensis TaxID=454156 RepID=A0ABV4QU50_9ACTN